MSHQIGSRAKAGVRTKFDASRCAAALAFVSRFRALPAGAAMALLLTVSAVPAPAQQAPTAGPEDVLAIVEGQPVTAEEFDVYFRAYLRRKLYHGGSESQVASLRSQALDQLILERLIAAEIESRAIAPDLEQVELQIENLKQRYGQSARWLEIEERLPALRRDLAAQSRLGVLKAQIERVDEPAEAELIRFYEDNPKYFTEPLAWDVAVILIGVPPSAYSDDWRAAEKRSRDLYNRILSGAEFSALAREVSAHDSAGRGGALGYVHQGQLAPEVETALEKLDLGQVTEPIRVLEGYVMFEKRGVRPAETHAYETVKARVRGLYLRARKEDNWEKFTKDLRRMAQVTVFKQGDASEQEGANPPN